MSLPSCPEVFCGRDKELATIQGIMDGEAQAHVLITGGIGVGKSCLTHYFLYQEATIGIFGSRRYLIPCDALQGHASGLQTIISTTLGVPEKCSKSREQLLAYLLKQSKPSLIVLDDFGV
jgi:Cdc6-like AAA superfamily ATPase